MDLRKDQNLSGVLSKALRDQREYMKEVDVGYQESDIVRCGEILSGHLAALQDAASPQEGLDCARTTVLALNELNVSCGYELIETDGRELICAFLIRAGALRGFNAEDEDITEEWREW